MPLHLWPVAQLSDLVSTLLSTLPRLLTLPCTHSRRLRSTMVPLPQRHTPSLLPLPLPPLLLANGLIGPSSRPTASTWEVGSSWRRSSTNTGGISMPRMPMMSGTFASLWALAVPLSWSTTTLPISRRRTLTRWPRLVSFLSDANL